MKLFTDSANVGGKYITIADRGDIRHMLRVLRLGEGMWWRFRFSPVGVYRLYYLCRRGAGSSADHG